MEFFNLRHPEEKAGFAEATRRGLASDQGLFYPSAVTGRCSSRSSPRISRRATSTR